MSDLGHVLVLAGGLSYEREVSLRSGRRVSEVLQAAGISVETRDTDASLVPSVLADPPDAVFVTLHGGAGEDGAIRSVLELLSVPYVGADPDACRVAYDKPTAKAVVRSVGLRTPESVTLPKETFHDLGATAVLARIVERLGLPLFVKPARGGSALGASVVREAADLPAAMVGCFAYGDTALIERCVEGVEVAVSVVDLGDGPVALPPVEIVPDAGVYDYAARYTAGHTEFFAPARLSPEVMEACARMAVTAHTALGLRDISRTDIIVDGAGLPHFLEVNVAPGMTETSLLPMAAEAAGDDLGTLCRVLLERAAARGA
ncbi:D-alanine-D-alanine ligase [Streptosporangium becharense]|uniref:D-alanine--D-alanine ligase n=1 Tax=Streptosporangium becharense TaxID=1816182 RepID=A0A7W9IGU4_9ACTN|nr:D-alanine--D-alanine ligase [Streptosporangium becharense]MBB2912724.1 D-alanine-D-alanine ligase [Streptosporangium becharense]MBB5820447.1 D-alanine-D-alanine ligase [Streptosporangium becharense]